MNKRLLLVESPWGEKLFFPSVESFCGHIGSCPASVSRVLNGKSDSVFNWKARWVDKVFMLESSPGVMELAYVGERGFVSAKTGERLIGPYLRTVEVTDKIY